MDSEKEVSKSDIKLLEYGSLYETVVREVMEARIDKMFEIKPNEPE